MTVDAPLAGLRVVECSDHEGVQYCGRTLAALGADVVKLEPTGGDPLRRRPPFLDGLDGEPHSVAFEYLNAGKRSVVYSPELGAADPAVEGLLAGAEVVLTSTDYMAALDDVPRPRGQVRAIAGGFGGRPDEGGPTTAFTRFHASTSGYLVPADKDRTVRPAWGGPYGAEAMFGIAFAVAVVAEVERGTGGEVDFSYQGYGIWMDKMFFPRVSLSETLDHHRYTTAYPFGGSMRCLDGFACIFVIEEHQWHSLATTLGRVEWLSDPKFANGVLRILVQEEIDEALAAWCAVRTVTEVLEAGRASDFPVARVRAPTEVLGWAQLAARGFLTEATTAFGDVTVAGLPFGADVPGVPLGPAPSLADRTTRWSAPRAAARPTGRRSDDLPLAGLKVLDFTWAAAGPIVTSIFAFLGADIVKVEHRSRPDLMRAAQKQYGYADDDDLDASPSFQEIAAGKRSIELDLRDPADRAVAFQLATVADVLVENMRPGKIEQLGLSYEAVAAVNPSIVMCSQSATARVEGAGIPGYAPIFWAEGGGAWLTGWPERRPGVVRGPVDFHAAAFACLGTVALLAHRARTGEGGYVDCSAIETVSSAFGPELLHAAVTGTDAIRSGNAFPGTLLNDVFPCHGDDQWLAVTIRDEADWRALGATLPDLLLGDRAPSDVSYDEIAAFTSSRDASRLEGRLLAAGVPAARSQSHRSALADARFAGRGIWQKVHHPVIGDQVIIGLPWTFDGRPYEMHHPGPNLGEHSEAIRKAWLET